MMVSAQVYQYIYRECRVSIVKLELKSLWRVKPLLALSLSHARVNGVRNNALAADSARHT